MSGSSPTLYAVDLSCCLPNEMPLDSWPGATEDSDKWYAIVRVGGSAFYDDETDEDVFVEEAYIEDVRRVEWELPEGVLDLRSPGACDPEAVSATSRAEAS